MVEKEDRATIVDNTSKSGYGDGDEDEDRFELVKDSEFIFSFLPPLPLLLSFVPSLWSWL